MLAALLPPLLQVVMLWLWLSYRFDDEAFPQRQKVCAGTPACVLWGARGGQQGLTRKPVCACHRRCCKRHSTFVLSISFALTASPAAAPCPQVEALAAELCTLLDKGLHRVTRMSKRGVDIGVQPASREHENVLECFADEAAALEEERRKERQLTRLRGGGAGGGSGGGAGQREERRERRRDPALVELAAQLHSELEQQQQQQQGQQGQQRGGSASRGSGAGAGEGRRRRREAMVAAADELVAAVTN